MTDVTACTRENGSTPGLVRLSSEPLSARRALIDGSFEVSFSAGFCHRASGDLRHSPAMPLELLFYLSWLLIQFRLVLVGLYAPLPDCQAIKASSR